MKKKFIFLFLVVFVSFAFSQANLKKEFKVSEGEKLYVNMKSSGDIYLKGWDKKIVSIHFLAEGANSDEIKTEVKKTDFGVSLETFYKFNGREYKSNNRLTVYVPEKFDLEIKTMGGEVDISNVEGEITGRTMGGELNFENLRGKINFTTMGGGIILKNSNIDGKIKTMGGRVLFEDIIGDVEGSSMGGNVIYKNVTSRSGKSTGKIVTISTMGGSINVDEAPSGAKVKTMGGNINIKSASEFVDAKTMGGDINIELVDGWVKATTMGGNIKVKIENASNKGKKDVELVSMSGDISLTVPEGFSMNFDIELAYTKNSQKDFKIISDFEIEKQRTKDWDYDNGSARKYVYGKGKVKGGKIMIKIETVNGNIYIKKSSK